MGIVVFWGILVILGMVFCAALNCYAKSGPTKRERKKLFALIYRMLAEGLEMGEVDIACNIALQILNESDEVEERFYPEENRIRYFIRYDGGLFEIRVKSYNGGTAAFIRRTFENAEPDRNTDGALDAAFKAIKEGDVEEVMRLFGDGLSVNAKHSSFGSTPLDAAAMSGRLEILRWLIGQGADVNTRDTAGYTPLLGILYALMRRAIQQQPGHQPGSDGDIDVSRVAPEERIRDAALLLMENGADIGVVGDKGFQAIHFAAAMEGTEVTEELLRRGADAEARDSVGSTPLHLAAALGKRAQAAVLTAVGARLETENDYGQTALIAAAQGGHHLMTEQLLLAGADPTHRSEHGMTALHFAAHNDAGETIRSLVRYGADMEAETDEGSTPLLVAAQEGRLEALRTLCMLGADTEHAIPTGQTALHAAAGCGHTECVRALLHAGADIDGRDGKGATALCWAANGGHAEVVELLCEAGARSDLAASGHTPEMLALRKGHYGIAGYLQRRCQSFWET